MKWKEDRKKLDGIISSLNKLDALEVQVGFFNTRYPDSNDNLYVAQVAQWQEEGVPANNIPPRPMFRTHLFSKITGGTYKILNRVVLTAVCDKQLTPRKAYEDVGEKLVEDLKNIIAEGVPPKNVDWWAAKKGNLPPLTHTGFMKDSVDYRVVKKSVGEE